MGATVKPFPLDVLPERLQNFAHEVADSTGAPLDHAGSGILAVASAAIGTTRFAAITRSWREPALAWHANIAEPGQGKSPLFGQLMKPVWKMEVRAADEYAAARDVYEAHRNEKDAKSERPPDRTHFVLSDATMEAIAQALNVNPRGVLFYLDELSAFVAQMDQYRTGKGADLPAWLKIWSCIPLPVARAGGRHLFVRVPYVTVMGGVQPDLLPLLATGAGGTLRADGFLDRFLFSFPDAEAFVDYQGEVSEETELDWERAVRFLYNLDHHPEPILLPLTPGARTAFHELRAANNKFGREKAPDVLKGRVAKSPAIAARLALVLQMLRASQSEDTSHEISERAIRDGWRLAHYYTDHARRAYGFIQGGALTNAVDKLLEWMRARKLTETSLRRVQKSGVAGVQYSADVHEMFAAAEDLGHGHKTDVPADTSDHKPGSRVPGFRLGPKPD